MTGLLGFLLLDVFWKPEFSIFRPSAEKKAFLLQGYRPFMLLAYQEHCLLQKNILIQLRVLGRILPSVGLDCTYTDWQR